MYREKIEAYLEAHKEEMLEDICTLCRINSEKSPYKEGMPYGEGNFHVLETALEMAEKYGFSIRSYDNYVGTADFNNLEKQLDILAHLDVVPAGEGWRVTEPFEPIVKDGKIYGRGTADDKGPAVAALYAMRAVKELDIPLKKNVRLILGTDEECGSSDIAHYYKTEEEAPMTFSPDASFPVINIEKGSLAGNFSSDFTESSALPKIVSIQAGIKVNVVPGKAHAVFQGISIAVLQDTGDALEQEIGIKFEFAAQEDVIHVTAIGNNAHAAHPQEGDNALTGLLSFITRLPFAPCEQITKLHHLAELFPHGDILGKGLGIAMADDLSGDLTLAFSLLEVTGDRLEGTFDSRCPLCSNEDNVLEVARTNMDAKGFILHNQSMRSSHYVSADSHFVKTLLKNYEMYTGRKGECQAIGGGTYVHELKNGVAFGAALPETDNRMHGADEFAVVEELMLSAKIFASVIVDLCS